MSGWPLYVLLAMAALIAVTGWVRRGERHVDTSLSEPDFDFGGDA